MLSTYSLMSKKKMWTLRMRMTDRQSMYICLDVGGFVGLCIAVGGFVSLHCLVVGS